MVESLSQPVPAGSIIPAGSPKDKRLAVKALLAAPRPLPDVEIARKCGVSSATVSRCRKELGSKGVQVTSDALSKRSEVNALFTDAADLSNAEIARRVGIDPATVGRYRRLFIEQGVEWVFGDGRKNSGRRTVYDKAYTRLEELKKLHPRRGGRDLWVMLTDGEGWPEEEVPSIARINAFLSEKKLTHPVKRVERNTGFWLTDRFETLNDRVGMDEKFHFYLTNGLRYKIIDLRDCYSGAVYAEPFDEDFARNDARGVDQLFFARVYLKYCECVGIPKILVLDNGSQQITRDGWLPEIARWCIAMGTILEWEPPATPTQNSHVERWHREIEKRWKAHVEFEPVYRREVAFEWMRRESWRETAVYPRHNLNRKPAASVYPIRRWDFDGLPGAHLPNAERIGHKGLTTAGTVRFHRRVESYGLINLHDADYIRVSDMLVGCKVRVDMLVKPGGEPGEGSVLDNHGNIVATFQHRLESGCKQGERLVFNVKSYGYEGGDDCRKVKNFSQDMYDEKVEKFQKNPRNKGFKKIMEQAARGELSD